MKKVRKNIKLYDEEWALTKKGKKLQHELKNAVSSILDRYVKSGCDPHDIERIYEGLMRLEMAMSVLYIRDENRKNRG